jgi:hypothetical protein
VASILCGLHSTAHSAQHNCHCHNNRPQVYKLQPNHPDEGITGSQACCMDLGP